MCHILGARQACTSGQGPTLKCAAGDCTCRFLTSRIYNGLCFCSLLGDPGLSDSTGLKCTSFPVAASFTATIGRLTFQTDQDGYYVSLYVPFTCGPSHLIAQSDGYAGFAYRHTGFNLPMSIQTNSDCPDVDCPTNFIVSCASVYTYELSVPQLTLSISS
jgi:hypothetical protein